MPTERDRTRGGMTFSSSHEASSPATIPGTNMFVNRMAGRSSGSPKFRPAWPTDKVAMMRTARIQVTVIQSVNPTARRVEILTASMVHSCHHRSLTGLARSLTLRRPRGARFSSLPGPQPCNLQNPCQIKTAPTSIRLAGRAGWMV